MLMHRDDSTELQNGLPEEGCLLQHAGMNPFLIAVTVCLVVAGAAWAGPERDAEGAVEFRLRAAKADRVELRAQWQKEPIRMERATTDADWAVRVLNVPAGVWEYSFSVDGMNVIDPANPALKPQRVPSKNILHLPSEPPALWDWQPVPHGTIHWHEYDSVAVGVRRELVVYTPPGYEQSEARYPLLILQHGAGDNQRAWVEHGKAHWTLDNLIAQGRAVPMVVLMLDGHPMGMVSRDDATKRMEAFAKFEEELFKQALPLVEAQYRVEKNAHSRAFAGLSMGGSQALQIGLKHTDQLAWIGAFSTAPGSTEIGQQLVADPATLNANLKLLWIACGEDDFVIQRQEQFIAMLTEAKVKHTGLRTKGDHSWPVWRRYLGDFLPLLFQN
jgi:enterochelin esterase-like enzyme